MTWILRVRVGSFIALSVLLMSCAPTIRMPSNSATVSFLYVGDAGTLPGVYAFLIDPTTGNLLPLPGSPYAASTGPYGVAADPAGRFVYVADNGHVPGIYAYTINPADGVLSPVAGSPFFAGTSPVSLAIDASGRDLYVADGSGASSGIYGYNIDPNSGNLTLISGSPFGSGTQPARINTDPSGRFVFASKTGGIYSYVIDPQTGGLSAASGSPYTIGSNNRGIAFDNSGTFLYLTNWGASPGVFGFRIQSSGVLTQIGTTPFPNGTATAQQISVVGDFLYVDGNLNSGGVYENTINPTTGALTLAATTPYLANTSNFGLAADPSGRFIYSSSTTAGVPGIYAAAINSVTGALTALTSGPFLTSTVPTVISTVEIVQP